MAKKKENAMAAAEENRAADTVAEEVETVAVPVAQTVPEEEPQPALSSASRRSSKERERAGDEYVASRNLRQEDAMIVGRYIAAQKRNNVLSGMISSVEVRGNHAFWAIYDGPVVVLIPFHEALPRVQDNDFSASKDALVRQRQMLAKSIGTVVPFSVEQVEPDGDTYLVFGSRHTAMQRIRKRYFGENAPNPVHVGDTVVGTFLGVGPHAAWLTVNGVDVRMLPRQLSHRYMDNMMEVFKPGEEISLKVRKMEEKNGELTLELSALPCELEACKNRHGRIRRGNRCAATITSHRVVSAINPRTKKREPYYVASMWLEGVEVPAFATMTSSHAKGNAHSGERVMVEIEDIARNGYVRCRIISYLP